MSESEMEALRLAIAAVNSRQASHEAVCAERYLNINENLKSNSDSLKWILRTLFTVSGAVILLLISGVAYFFDKSEQPSHYINIPDAHNYKQSYHKGLQENVHFLLPQELEQIYGECNVHDATSL